MGLIAKLVGSVVDVDVVVAVDAEVVATVAVVLRLEFLDQYWAAKVQLEQCCGCGYDSRYRSFDDAVYCS